MEIPLKGDTCWNDISKPQQVLAPNECAFEVILLAIHERSAPKHYVVCSAIKQWMTQGQTYQ